MLLKILNPPSKLWTEAAPRAEKNFHSLRGLLAGPSHNFKEVGLLDPPISVCKAELLNPDNAESVILDITTLPKKFFLFAILRLVDSNAVKNLVVTYSRAQQYTEQSLYENALPPAAIQGFLRERSGHPAQRMIVGVGYTALSVDELLDQGKTKRLDFIFPFPPGSPAFRRNWRLLSTLMSSDYQPKTTEIHRVQGMDAFEIYERARAWGGGYDLDMLPFGPKPHALGMAMACMRLDGCAQLIYSQPQAYRFDYSQGIARDQKGFPQIYAYCLKKDGKETF